MRANLRIHKSEILSENLPLLKHYNGNRISKKVSRFYQVFSTYFFSAGTLGICLYIWCRLNNWCYDWSWLATASAPPSQKSRHNPTFGPICPTITTNKYFSEELKVFIKINLPYKVLQLFSDLQREFFYCKDFGYLQTSCRVGIIFLQIWIYLKELPNS